MAWKLVLTKIKLWIIKFVTSIKNQIIMNKPKIIIMNKALKIYYQEVKYQMRDFKRFKNFSSNK